MGVEFEHGSNDSQTDVTGATTPIVTGKIALVQLRAARADGKRSRA
jgi:hypothetical protein